MRTRLVTAPPEEPIKLLEAIEQCRVTDTTQHAQLVRLITDAREWAEGFLGFALITQTWADTQECFPSEFVLGKHPVQSVTSVKYFDSANAEQTVNTNVYQVDMGDYDTRIVLATGKSWPGPVYDRVDAVKVTYVAGYGAASAVPEPIRHAQLLHVEAYYDRDERAMEMLLEAAHNLIRPYRAPRF